MTNKKISRRGLLKTAVVTGGVFGVASGFQNCAPVKMSGKDDLGSLSCDDDSREADPDINTIADQPVRPAIPGTDDDITAVYTEVLHRSQVNTAANNSQKMLIVSVGPNPSMGMYAPIRFQAFSAMLGVSEILCYVPGTPQPVFRRMFHAGDVIPETIFLIDSTLAALEPTVTIVIKNVTTGYWKKEIALTNPQPYSNFVKPFVPNTPFGSSTFQRPYVAGAGMASGGQNDLGALHMPRFDVSGNNIDVTLGIDVKHPRINENHYVAGCGLYDQNGHPIGPIATIMYGTNYTDFSIAHFTDLRLAERGASLIRTVVFDTYNGYLMGFHKL